MPQPQISLTDFVDIISKSGRPKATKVLQVKDRPEYEPAFDFYKPFREHLVATHRANGEKKTIAKILDEIKDIKKISHYPPLVEGYKKWWGTKNLKWFSPPRGVYISSGIEIIVNPELGLSINGQRHVVKLYFKPEPLTALRIEVITELLEYQLRRSVNDDDHFSVLDVRKAKLFTGQRGGQPSIRMVNAEIAYIASIWNQE